MGSYGNAIMAGFICRLCSEQKKCVIHLYSVKAKKLALLEKIKLIPIKVDKYDKLPKTVCESCIEKLDMQYRLIQQIRRSSDIQRQHTLFHSNGRCPAECPLYGIIRQIRTQNNETPNEIDINSNEVQINGVEIEENREYGLSNQSETEIAHRNETNNQ